MVPAAFMPIHALRIRHKIYTHHTLLLRLSHLSHRFHRCSTLCSHSLLHPLLHPRFQVVLPLFICTVFPFTAFALPTDDIVDRANISVRLALRAQ